MPIAFVLDENLRGKPLWHAIRHHNLGGGLRIDATRVGDPTDLPLGSPDSDILVWADRTDRIILAEDAATFAAELAAHLRLGRTSAGVYVIRPSATVASILSWLELVVADDHPDQWTDRVTYIPRVELVPRTRPHVQQCNGNHGPAVADRRSRPGSRRRSWHS